MLVGGAVAVLRPRVVSCQSGQDTAASSPVTFQSSSGQTHTQACEGPGALGGWGSRREQSAWGASILEREQVPLHSVCFIRSVSLRGSDEVFLSGEVKARMHLLPTCA